MEACLKTSRISVIVNSSPTNEFPMERGLRQGDPLASLLFLVAECLHIMVDEPIVKGLYKRVKVGKGEVVISHLQYVEDVIFFDPMNIMNLVKLLHCFHAVLGSKFNMVKSKIFGLGVDEEDVQSWARTLGCGSGSLPFIYLGLPVGTLMIKLVSGYRKMKNKLATWKGRFISFGGRWTLVRLANWSLLEKWWWRFHIMHESLWRMVIVNLYGKEGWLSGVEVKGYETVWENIIKIGKDLGGVYLQLNGSIWLIRTTPLVRFLLIFVINRGHEDDSSNPRKMENRVDFAHCTVRLDTKMFRHLIKHSTLPVVSPWSCTPSVVDDGRKTRTYLRVAGLALGNLHKHSTPLVLPSPPPHSKYHHARKSFPKIPSGHKIADAHPTDTELHS
ncbi:LOW QUALITY PROTEIN: hypothetical protein OSB04_012168 [Centaurea solstitialis]|uniref:Reverse transcriptase domain-containing protein n=1 Tax=Centaurea solstitialis TaxID=347529 RepID=A0AA38WPS6_9ASTR|nr:LOW QUALITY PROTEIN: hypothetical protein OSB04_012168 [Centaurea solstitialis]